MSLKVVKVIESNVNMISVAEYSDEQFETLLEKYRKENTLSCPGATSSRIESFSYIV